MVQYQYKMVQMATGVVVSKEKDSKDAVAKYLQLTVNQVVMKGWEFYRVDNFSVAVEPGCLGRLFGQRAEVTNYNVITFRRPIKG